MAQFSQSGYGVRSGAGDRRCEAAGGICPGRSSKAGGRLLEWEGCSAGSQQEKALQLTLRATLHIPNLHGPAIQSRARQRSEHLGGASQPERPTSTFYKRVSVGHGSSYSASQVALASIAVMQAVSSRAGCALRVGPSRITALPCSLRCRPVSGQGGAPPWPGTRNCVQRRCSAASHVSARPLWPPASLLHNACFAKCAPVAAGWLCARYKPPTAHHSPEQQT